MTRPSRCSPIILAGLLAGCAWAPSSAEWSRAQAGPGSAAARDDAPAKIVSLDRRSRWLVSFEVDEPSHVALFWLEAGQPIDLFYPHRRGEATDFSPGEHTVWGRRGSLIVTPLMQSCLDHAGASCGDTGPPSDRSVFQHLVLITSTEAIDVEALQEALNRHPDLSGRERGVVYDRPLRERIERLGELAVPGGKWEADVCRLDPHWKFRLGPLRCS